MGGYDLPKSCKGWVFEPGLFLQAFDAPSQTYIKLYPPRSPTGVNSHLSAWRKFSASSRTSIYMANMKISEWKDACVPVEIKQENGRIYQFPISFVKFQFSIIFLGAKPLGILREYQWQFPEERNMFLICLNTLSPVSFLLCPLFIFLPTPFHPLFRSPILFLVGFSHSMKFFSLWKTRSYCWNVPSWSRTKAPVTTGRAPRIQEHILQEPWTSPTPEHFRLRCPVSVITQWFPAHASSTVQSCN